MTTPVDYLDVEWQMERLSSFHKEYQHFEREHLELRTLLRDAETALRSDPENEAHRVREYYLKRRLGEIEERCPWLASGNAPEIVLWTPFCG